MNTDHYIVLLTKRFTGEINEQERKDLDSWISQSEANKRLAMDMDLLWHTTNANATPLALDLDADFKRLKSSIHAEAQQPALKSSWGWKLSRIAAAGLLLLAALWLFMGKGASTGLNKSLLAQDDRELVSLQDGSKVWLKSGSKLEFSDDIENAKTRQVRLSGEAFFEVAHNPERPFQVLLNDGGKVEVLGTSFDVKSTAASAHTAVIVRSGKVRFTPVSGQKGVVLTPMQKAQYNRSSHKLEVSTLANLNEISWFAQELSFVDIPLSEAIRQIETHYDAVIKLENVQMTTCRYTSPLTLKLEDKSVETILKTLSIPFDIKVEKEKDRVFVLKGGKCIK